MAVARALIAAPAYNGAPFCGVAVADPAALGGVLADGAGALDLEVLVLLELLPKLLDLGLLLPFEFLRNTDRNQNTQQYCGKFLPRKWETCQEQSPW